MPSAAAPAPAAAPGARSTGDKKKGRVQGGLIGDGRGREDKGTQAREEEGAERHRVRGSGRGREDKGTEAGAERQGRQSASSDPFPPPSHVPHLRRQLLGQLQLELLHLLPCLGPVPLLHLLQVKIKKFRTRDTNQGGFPAGCPGKVGWSGPGEGPGPLTHDPPPPAPKTFYKNKGAPPSFPHKAQALLTFISALRCWLASSALWSSASSSPPPSWSRRRSLSLFFSACSVLRSAASSSAARC